jgi:putative two-component system response regulator
MNIYKSRKTINISKAKILAVDDEQDLCDMVASWLNREGISCDTAYCVDDAVSLMRRNNYDLVVSDIMMPGKSGIDLLRIVSESFPATAMIMATAVDKRETAVLTLEKGAFGYVIKPFERNEFVINIINVLERRRIVLEHDRYEKQLEQLVRERTKDIHQREEEIALKLISASGYRDEETGDHIKRIGLFGAILAERIGWDQERVDYMRIAGPMHDVGKIGVPDEILHKPGKLTPDEFEKIKEHTLIGKKILEGTEIPLIQMAKNIAEYHHEKWNGSGYPHGLKENAIPESAQIVAVADVYDALSNDRVYRAALPEEKVLSIMEEGKGGHFNPDIVKPFLEVLPAFRDILNEHGDK